MKNSINNISIGRILILSSLLLMTFFYIKFMNHGMEVEPLKPFSTFPKEIGEWKGQEQFFSSEIYQAVGVDDSTLISFMNSMNESIQLYIGYYKSQKEGDLIHSPKNCMPGAGWVISDTQLVDVDISKDKSIKIIKLLLEKGPEKQIVLYWFHSRGRIINSEYKQKLFLVIDSIFRNRTDDSFVRLIAPVGMKNDKETVEYMKRFIIQMFPILDEYIPE